MKINRIDIFSNKRTTVVLPLNDLPEHIAQFINEYLDPKRTYGIQFNNHD